MAKFTKPYSKLSAGQVSMFISNTDRVVYIFKKSPYVVSVSAFVFLIIWHSGHACFEFAGFRKQNIHSLSPFP